MEDAKMMEQTKNVLLEMLNQCFFHSKKIEEYIKKHNKHFNFLLLEFDCDFNINFVKEKTYSEKKSSNDFFEKNIYHQIAQDNYGNVFTIYKNNVDNENYIIDKYSKVLDNFLKINNSSLIVCTYINWNDLEKTPNTNISQLNLLLEKYKNRFFEIFLITKEECFKIYKITKNKSECCLTISKDLIKCIFSKYFVK